jgi:hypothetical protein
MRQFPVQCADAKDFTFFIASPGPENFDFLRGYQNAICYEPIQ